MDKYEAHLARARANSHSRYHQRKQAGLCITCAVPVTGRTECEECRMVRKTKDADRNMRRNAGLPVRAYRTRVVDYLLENTHASTSREK